MKIERFLVTTGFVYAIYENEESVRQILHVCSTKTERTMGDGRCEYYLEMYSRRATSRRKSVRKVHHLTEKHAHLLFFRFRLFLGLWFVFQRQWRIESHLLHLLGRFPMVCRTWWCTEWVWQLGTTVEFNRMHQSNGVRRSFAWNDDCLCHSSNMSGIIWRCRIRSDRYW